MIRFAGAAVLLLVLTSPVPAKPLHLMAVGDSLVQGGNIGNDEYTFRYPLYLGLRRAGYEVDMVGAHQRGLRPDYRWPRDFDLDHEGFYGETTAQIEAHLTEDLPRVPAPDWAVFFLGENDGTSVVARNTAQPLERMIGLLRAKNPRVGVVVIQVPGYWREMMLHASMDRLAHDLATAASPVVTVPLFDHWNKETDTYDGDHPNAAGQRKIAQMVLEAILPHLP